MKRIERWETRLHEAIDLHSDAKFELGVSDCFIMVMDALLAVTGEDPYPEYRGQYTTPQGYYKHLKKRGFNDITEAIDAILPPVAVALAQRGDIGYLDTDDGPCLGVFVGGGCIFKLEQGATLLPITSVSGAWHVGE
jgi:hypothetical protein